ncbi:MAG: RNA polymerase sigma factor [Caldisericaceae bacterium]
MNKYGDEDLVKRIKDGDEVAFRQFYERFFLRVYKYASRRVRNRESSEDITSEVFLRILKGIKNFEVRGKDSLDVWVYSIARNVVCDWFRKNAGVEVLPLEEGFIEVLAPILNDPYSTAEREEVERYIKEALSELQENYREVIEMRFYRRKKLADIAFELGKSVDAVKVMQFRALKNLKDKVEEKIKSAKR